MASRWSRRIPREVVIEVDNKGRISIARTYMSPEYLYTVMRKTVNDHGQSTPVVIRGDGLTKHDAVKQVMDACTRAGLWKVKFAAVKERSS
jgi:biopolymer transport protein ExbD